MLQRTLIVAMFWLTSDALAADAPSEVTDAVKKKYPDARIVSVKQEKERNKEKPIYYVTLERGKEEMDVDVALRDSCSKGQAAEGTGVRSGRQDGESRSSQEEPPRPRQERSRADGDQGTSAEVATLGPQADLRSLNPGVNGFSLTSALIKWLKLFVKHP